MLNAHSWVFNVHFLWINLCNNTTANAIILSFTFIVLLEIMKYLFRNIVIKFNCSILTVYNSYLWLNICTETQKNVLDVSARARASIYVLKKNNINLLGNLTFELLIYFFEVLSIDDIIPVLILDNNDDDYYDEKKLWWVQSDTLMCMTRHSFCAEMN